MSDISDLNIYLVNAYKNTNIFMWMFCRIYISCCVPYVVSDFNVNTLVLVPFPVLFFLQSNCSLIPNWLALFVSTDVSLFTHVYLSLGCLVFHCELFYRFLFPQIWLPWTLSFLSLKICTELMVFSSFLVLSFTLAIHFCPFFVYFDFYYYIVIFKRYTATCAMK